MDVHCMPLVTVIIQQQLFPVTTDQWLVFFQVDLSYVDKYWRQSLVGQQCGVKAVDELPDSFR